MAGLLQALIDALHGEDERIGGRRFTQLTADLTSATTASMAVQTTREMGEDTDGSSNARLLVNGEIITATGRTNTTFTTLTRGVLASEVLSHPKGSIVYDYSRNKSALDLVRRGFLVNYAVGADLATVARNLGLHRCPMAEEVFRALIKAIAYLPKQPIGAFHHTLDTMFGVGNYEVIPEAYEKPGGAYTIRVYVETPLTDTLLGKFYLNGGEEALSTAATTVDVAHDIQAVLSVYVANGATRRGIFGTLPNVYEPGGSFVSKTITLGTSVGGAGVALICNYTAHFAHYTVGRPQSDPSAATKLPFNVNGALPPDASNIRNIVDDEPYAYLADSLAAVRCVLDQIRAAGIRVLLISRSP